MTAEDRNRGCTWAVCVGRWYAGKRLLSL